MRQIILKVNWDISVCISFLSHNIVPEYQYKIVKYMHFYLVQFL